MSIQISCQQGRGLAGFQDDGACAEPSSTPPAGIPGKTLQVFRDSLLAAHDNRAFSEALQRLQGHQVATPEGLRTEIEALLGTAVNACIQIKDASDFIKLSAVEI